MAAAIMKLFCVVFLVSCLIGRGFCACSLDNIHIGTSRTETTRGGMPEWDVVVTNNCPCAQKLIYLSCAGFQTAEPVSTSILSKHGDKCLLINGNVLDAGASVKFSYAWNPPFLLLPSSAVGIGC